MHACRYMDGAWLQHLIFQSQWHAVEAPVPHSLTPVLQKPCQAALSPSPPHTSSFGGRCQGPLGGFQQVSGPEGRPPPIDALN